MEWISVKDRLPENDNRVLVIYQGLNDRYIDFARFIERNKYR